MATIDALRRADIPVVAVAVDTTLQIKGATGQTIVADSLIPTSTSPTPTG